MLRERQLYMGVDKGRKRGDLSCISIVEVDGQNTRVLYTAHGITPSSALESIYEELKGLQGIDLDYLRKNIDTNGDVVYTLTSKIKGEFKPQCFQECTIAGCDMQRVHCGINEFPPMSKCTRCIFWFVNSERIDDNERRK